MKTNTQARLNTAANSAPAQEPTPVPVRDVSGVEIVAQHRQREYDAALNNLNALLKEFGDAIDEAAVFSFLCGDMLADDADALAKYDDFNMLGIDFRQPLFRIICEVKIRLSNCVDAMRENMAGPRPDGLEDWTTALQSLVETIPHVIGNRSARHAWSLGTQLIAPRLDGLFNNVCHAQAQFRAARNNLEALAKS